MNFFYKGRERFSTGWGRCVSVTVMVGYCALVGLKLTEFFGETDPIHYFSETRQNLDNAIELSQLGFTFAVEEFPADVGKVEAH